MSEFGLSDTIKVLVAESSRNIDRAKNGFKYLIGAEKIDVGITPKETVWSYDKVQLFRYRNQKVLYSTPIVLVMSLISRSYVLDLRPNKSLVEYLTKRGFDVFLVDWGVPDGFEAGNSLETYTHEYLGRIVENVIRISGAESATLYGYCLGGDLALLYAASHPEAPIRNLVTMATPVNFFGMGPTVALLRDDRFDLQKLIGWDGNVSAADIANSFKLLKPTGDLIGRANLIENLWDDEFMDGYLAMSRWTGEHVPFPGKAFLQIVDLLIRRNCLAVGKCELGGEVVSLSSIKCSLLNVIAEKDHIVPIECASPVTTLVGSKDAVELRLPAGHAGLIVGRQAADVTMPKIADWIEARSALLDGDIVSRVGRTDERTELV